MSVISGESQADRVSFESVSFEGASLGKASFVRTQFRDVLFSDVRLEAANFTSAIFISARVGSLPPATEWPKIQGLETIRIELDAQPAFYALREDFKKAGLRSQERQVTAALKQASAATLDQPQKFLAQLGFGFTVEYGNKPTRALILILLITIALAPFYAIALSHKRDAARAGVRLIWEKGHNKSGKEGGKIFKVLSLPPKKALVGGFYFSLLSAFQLGWRELNVGSWLSQMQRREYILRPYGWVRTVSGVQSLVSVYLLAIWALSTFGRPFE